MTTDLKCKSWENVRLGTRKINYNMALFIQAFGEDSTKNTWNCRKCKMLKHEIVVWMLNGTLWLHWVCSSWWALQQQTSVTGRNGEAVCIVKANVSGQCVPHIWIHIYASDKGDSSSTVVCFDISWETGHPDMFCWAVTSD